MSGETTFLDYFAQAADDEMLFGHIPVFPIFPREPKRDAPYREVLRNSLRLLDSIIAEDGDLKKIPTDEVHRVL